MAAQLVNAEPQYAKVNLVEPTTLGYIHVAATVRPGPIPLVLPSAARAQLLAALKELARQLEQLDAVVSTDVFRASFLPPAAQSSSYLKGQAATLHLPRFDVVVLIETSSPAAIADVQAAPLYQALVEAVRHASQDLHIIAARNAKRVGDVVRKRKGLFLFNYFVADDAEVGLELWDYLAGWYAVETRLDNSILLVPQEGEQTDYSFINFARWDMSLPRFLWHQVTTKSFRSYVLANLEANRVGSMPILYRLV